MAAVALGIIPPLLLGLAWDEIMSRKEDKGKAWDPRKYSSQTPSSEETPSKTVAASVKPASSSHTASALGNANLLGSAKLTSPSQESEEQERDQAKHHPFYRTGYRPGCHLLAYDDAKENAFVDRSKGYVWDAEPTGHPTSALQCNATTCSANVVTDSAYQRSFENERISYTGKYVNTMTGEEYDTFEDDPPPATGDYQSLAAPRRLEMLQGTSDERDPVRRRKEVSFQDVEMAESRFFEGPGQKYDKRAELTNMVNRDISMNMNGFRPEGDHQGAWSSTGQWSRAEGAKGYVGYVNMARYTPFNETTMRSTQEEDAERVGPANSLNGEPANMSRPNLVAEANRPHSQRMSNPDGNGCVSKKNTTVHAKQTSATKTHATDQNNVLAVAGKTSNQTVAPIGTKLPSVTTDHTNTVFSSGGGVITTANPLKSAVHASFRQPASQTSRAGVATTANDGSAVTVRLLAENAKEIKAIETACARPGAAVSSASFQSFKAQASKLRTDQQTLQRVAIAVSEGVAPSQQAAAICTNLTQKLNVVARVGQGIGSDSASVRQVCDELMSNVSELRTTLRVAVEAGMNIADARSVVDNVSNTVESVGHIGAALGTTHVAEIRQALTSLKTELLTAGRVGGAAAAVEGSRSQAEPTNNPLNSFQAAGPVGSALHTNNSNIQALAEVHGYEQSIQPMAGGEGNATMLRQSSAVSTKTDSSQQSLSQPNFSVQQVRSAKYTSTSRTRDTANHINTFSSATMPNILRLPSEQTSKRNE